MPLLFRKKFPFSRPKFLSDDLFLVIDHNFQIFPIFLSYFDPFFTREAPVSENNSSITPFLLCSYFRTHPTTLLLKRGGTGAWAVPLTSNFGVTVPQSPLGLRPCNSVCYTAVKSIN